MQSDKNLKICFLGVSTIVLCAVLAGCKTDKTVYEQYTVTKTGKNEVESEVREEQRRRSGSSVVQRQIFREKRCCLGPNGEMIRAKTPEACIKAGGKMIDEVLIQERVIK